MRRGALAWAVGLLLVVVARADGPVAGDPSNRDGWGAYLSVPDVRKAWADGLGLDRSDVKELPGGIRRHRAWTTKDACEVVLYEVPVGGHRWPANLGEPARSTATEMVEFFEGKR